MKKAIFVFPVLHDAARALASRVLPVVSALDLVADPASQRTSSRWTMEEYTSRRRNAELLE
jgi:hypothetical protein